MFSENFISLFAYSRENSYTKISDKELFDTIGIVDAFSFGEASLSFEECRSFLWLRRSMGYEVSLYVFIGYLSLLVGMSKKTQILYMV